MKYKYWVNCDVKLQYMLCVEGGSYEDAIEEAHRTVRTHLNPHRFTQGPLGSVYDGYELLPSSAVRVVDTKWEEEDDDLQ